MLRRGALLYRRPAELPARVRRVSLHGQGGEQRAQRFAHIVGIDRRETEKVVRQLEHASAVKHRTLELREVRGQMRLLDRQP